VSLMGIFEESRCITLQMQGIQFGHLDRRLRYNRIIGALHSANAFLSFPEVFKDQHQLKGFYRLINNKAITHSTFISGYQSGLVQYSKEQEETPPWILIQDTMLTDYNSRNLDLGYTQTLKSNGFLLHHGLLLDESYHPLGLLHQQVIHRERNEFGKASECENKSIIEKESNKWIEGIETGIKFSQDTGRHLIHVMDREADIAEVINKCTGSEQYFIIRARHDRSTLTTTEKDKSDAPELFRIFHLLPTLEHPGSITRTLRNTKGKEYQADCYLNFRSFRFRGIKQAITGVWIREKNAVDDSPPAEWFLLTNLPVRNMKEAEQIGEIYSKRWTVEDFHKCYKTGCSIEKRQFDSRKTLTTSIGLLALTAVTLLRSRYFAKNAHNESFETIVTDSKQQELAKKLADKYLKPVDSQICQQYSTLWWLLLLGRMGGHQGFKQKGLPGWQTLWKGYAYFQSLSTGFNLSDNTS